MHLHDTKQRGLFLGSILGIVVFVSILVASMVLRKNSSSRPLTLSHLPTPFIASDAAVWNPHQESSPTPAPLRDFADMYLDAQTWTVEQHTITNNKTHNVLTLQTQLQDPPDSIPTFVERSNSIGTVLETYHAVAPTVVATHLLASAGVCYGNNVIDSSNPAFATQFATLKDQARFAAREYSGFKVAGEARYIQTLSPQKAIIRSDTETYLRWGGHTYQLCYKPPEGGKLKNLSEADEVVAAFLKTISP